jgi:release factor glutamine methyltransferase
MEQRAAGNPTTMSPAHYGSKCLNTHPACHIVQLDRFRATGQRRHEEKTGQIMSQEQGRTVAAVLKVATEYLQARGIEQPRLAAELLLSRLLNCRRLDVYLKHEMVLSERHLEAMRRGVKRVADHEPVQYVLGQVEFMGRVFIVDRRALIPRPETEILTETVLSFGPLWREGREPGPVVVDVGTGSGCIILSIALERPGALCVGFDISAEALALAGRNAALHKLENRVALLGGNDLSEAFDPETADAVVANLPYVRTSEYEALPPHIREHEPRAALDGGRDGLGPITECVEESAVLLKAGGACFLEIGHDQAGAVAGIMEANGFARVTVRQDMAGRDRVVWGVLE